MCVGVFEDESFGGKETIDQLLSASHLFEHLSGIALAEDQTYGASSPPPMLEVILSMIVGNSLVGRASSGQLSLHYAKAAGEESQAASSGSSLPMKTSSGVGDWGLSAVEAQRVMLCG